jgi:RNA polymerase sigma factor (sigma-70 family)
LLTIALFPNSAQKILNPNSFFRTVLDGSIYLHSGHGMESARWRPVLQYIRRIAEPNQARRVSDGTLLDRFITLHDEDAFATLVKRHGPLVMGVGRRMLHDIQDAEDVFQATFLVLVRKARSIGKPECLAQWLYGVAYRTALRARSDAAERRFHECRAAESTDLERDEEFLGRDLRRILDEEIQWLSRSYRDAVVLCYFGGKTKEEAARILGLPVGTVSSRLARARGKLRARLTRRGVAFSGGLLAALLAPQMVEASVSGLLARATTQAALAMAAGQSLAGGLVSTKIASLTEGIVRTMFLFKVKIAAVAVAAALVVGVGAGAVGYRTASAQDQKADPSMEGRLREEIAQLKKELNRAEQEIERLKQERKDVKVAAQREGALAFVGTELKERENVPDDELVIVMVGNDKKKYRRLRVGDRVETNQLLGRIDDRLARDEMVIKEKKLAVAEAELVTSEKTRDEAKQRYDTQVQLHKNKSTSLEEVRGAKLTWDRYMSEVEVKKATVQVTQAELTQARTSVQMHEIRSPIRGVIKAILKNPGEGVQSLETVFVVRPGER